MVGIALSMVGGLLTGCIWRKINQSVYTLWNERALEGEQILKNLQTYSTNLATMNLSLL